jgi:uncharacterized membrane protein YgcG
MFGSVLFFLILLFSALPAFPADVTLAWDPNSELDLQGYGVYYQKGVAGPPYMLYGYVATDELNDSTNPTFTITGLEKGAQYYFALTAYDTAGNESNFSYAVCAEVDDVIAPCGTESLIDDGGGSDSSSSSDESSSSGESSSGGSGTSNSGGGGGACFIDTSSSDVTRFNPQTSALTALGCIVAFIRIAHRHFKRFLLFVRSEPGNATFNT